MDQAAVDEVARMFVQARKTGERLDALPERLKPANFADSLAVMGEVDRMVGEKSIGTKIAAKPGAEVVYTTLHAGRAFTSPARIPVALVPSKYMECEISFRLLRDLPPRATDYSEQEVFDALEACPAFEAVDCRFKDLAATMAKSPYDFYADHIAAGAMVFGDIPQGLAEIRLHQDEGVAQAGRAHHHREDRRPSDRQSGDPGRGARQHAARHHRIEGRHDDRDRLLHRVPFRRLERAGARRVRRLRHDGSDHRRLSDSRTNATQGKMP